MSWLFSLLYFYWVALLFAGSRTFTEFIPFYNYFHALLMLLDMIYLALLRFSINPNIDESCFILLFLPSLFSLLLFFDFLLIDSFIYNFTIYYTPAVTHITFSFLYFICSINGISFLEIYLLSAPFSFLFSLLR